MILNFEVEFEFWKLDYGLQYQFDMWIWSVLYSLQLTGWSFKFAIPVLYLDSYREKCCVIFIFKKFWRFLAFARLFYVRKL